MKKHDWRIDAKDGKPVVHPHPVTKEESFKYTCANCRTVFFKIKESYVEPPEWGCKSAA